MKFYTWTKNHFFTGHILLALAFGRILISVYSIPQLIDRPEDGLESLASIPILTIIISGFLIYPIILFFIRLGSSSKQLETRSKSLAFPMTYGSSS